jgi:hypothetical protein
VRGGGEVDRRALRRALLAAEPWLGATEVGPASVDAGSCDRCGALPRVIPTCGPAGHAALCRDCALAVGPGGWCDGHRQEGEEARRWAASLPSSWPRTVVLWWFSTGELRSIELADGVPDELAAGLPEGGDDRG